LEPKDAHENQEQGNSKGQGDAKGLAMEGTNQQGQDTSSINFFIFHVDMTYTHLLGIIQGPDSLPPSPY
jgi:hypothetical protein